MGYGHFRGKLLSGLTDDITDDETDMAELEKNLRAIEKDGLVWGASKVDTSFPGPWQQLLIFS